MADLDPRIQKLLDNPSYKAIEKSDPDRAKRILGTARARLASAPTPWPMPGAIATPSPMGGAPTPSPTPTPSYLGPLDPLHYMEQKRPLPLAYGERALSAVGEKYDDALSSVLGTTGGSAMSEAAHFPRTYPELAMQATNLIPGGEAAGPGMKILKGAAIPAIISLLTNSRMSPATSAVSGALGTVIGGAGEKLTDLRMGGAGSKFLQDQLGEDLNRSGVALAHGVPDVVPKVLEGPGQFLNYYSGRAVDRFGHIKHMADGMLQQAKALEPQMKALEAQANALRAKAANTHPALKQYYLRQASALDFQASAGDMAKANGEALMQDFIRRSKGFNALRKFFGKRSSYEAGYKDLLLDTGKLQTWLADGANIENMRNSGISEDAINELRRVVYRRYDAKPEDIMIQMDKGPDPFLPGFRLHWYHAAPRPITHVNMPRPARMAGTPLKMTPRAGWKPALGALGTGLGFAAGEFIEPDSGESDTEGETYYPPPASER